MFNNNVLRKCFVLLNALVVVQPLMAAPTEFLFTVDTQLSASPDTFTIPTYGAGYKYDVDCDNDGNLEATLLTGNYTCDYTGMGGPGVYTIHIKSSAEDGTGFPRVRFDDLGEADALIELNNWGPNLWETMDSAFEGANNMEVTATDIPDFSNVTSMNDMFRYAALANPDTNAWDTSEVTNMRYMFYAAYAANPDTSSWDTRNVTTMSSMFGFAISANPDTSGWVTAKVIDMSYMFINAAAANPDTSSWDITDVTTMEAMFSGVTLPLASYDAMLVHFNSQAVQAGVSFSGGDSKYCATAARDNLINTDGWIISDGGLSSECSDVSFSDSFE